MNMSTEKKPIAQTAFENPYVSVKEPPMASQARKAIGPSAVLPTRKADLRARSGVYRSA